MNYVQQNSMDLSPASNLPAANCHLNKCRVKKYDKLKEIRKEEKKAEEGRKERRGHKGKEEEKRYIWGTSTHIQRDPKLTQDYPKLLAYTPETKMKTPRQNQKDSVFSLYCIYTTILNNLYVFIQ